MTFVSNPCVFCAAAGRDQLRNAPHNANTAASDFIKDLLRSSYLFGTKHKMFRLGPLQLTERSGGTGANSPRLLLRSRPFRDATDTGRVGCETVRWNSSNSSDED